MISEPSHLIWDLRTLKGPGQPLAYSVTSGTEMWLKERRMILAMG